MANDRTGINLLDFLIQQATTEKLIPNKKQGKINTITC
jgi:hypothetical protein